MIFKTFIHAEIELKLFCQDCKGALRVKQEHDVLMVNPCEHCIETMFTAGRSARKVRIK